MTSLLDRQRRRETFFREHRDAQPVHALAAATPPRSANGTGELAVVHALPVRDQDLRAAPLHHRLITVGRREVRERGLRTLSFTTFELAAIGALEKARGLLRPRRRHSGHSKARPAG